MDKINNKLSSQRLAGVLLHISSLPQGDLGADAYRFVGFLHEIGASVWQTLPLNAPHADGSPYQCLSAHAGNPAFISTSLLLEQGLLTEQDIEDTQALEKDQATRALIEKVFTRHLSAPDDLTQTGLKRSFDDFCVQHAHWLDDFALFLVLREQFHSASWNLWPDAYKYRETLTLQHVRQEFAHQVAIIKFTQYIFFQQWHALKHYANSKQVYLFGDIPIFVAFDSADVWAQPALFKLDETMNATVIAGVPPDYFSDIGQRWGNPHYNWQAMQQDGFSWWLARISTQHELFDMVRIDHFRGLQAAWEIPAQDETAINGSWVLAPGDELLAAITTRIPDISLVAEDLGIITPEVDALRKKYDLPGMKILQFAFDGSPDNPYLPQNIEPNSVVYTGTHDNDTTMGWYSTLDDHQRYHLHDYLNHHEPNMPYALIELALSSSANLAIIPLQDLLELDASHRMNIPGTALGNWQWRFDWWQLKSEMQDKIAGLIDKYGRNPNH